VTDLWPQRGSLSTGSGGCVSQTFAFAVEPSTAKRKV